MQGSRVYYEARVTGGEYALKANRFEFTAKKVDALPFSKGGNDRPEYRDTEMPGLVLRVSKTEKNYYLMKKHPTTGEFLRQPLGNHLKLTPEQARIVAEKYLTAEGGAAQAEAQMGAQTVKQLAELFLDKHVRRKLKETTQKDYTRQINLHIIPEFGELDPTKITRPRVRKFFDERTDVAPQQANKFLVVMSSMFSFAQSRDLVEHNPCDKIAPNEGKRRTRILSDLELHMFLEALNNVEPVKRHYFWLCVLLGQRRTETALMQWRHYTAKPGVWTIPDTLTKNGVTHSIPLPPLATEHLSALKRHTGAVPYCFYTWAVKHNREPGPIDPKYLTRFVTRLQKQHMKGVPKFTIHDLRRTAATNISSLVKDRAKVKQVLNHINKADVTGVYDLYSYDDVKLESLSKWEGRLRELIPAKVIERSLAME